LKKKNGLNDQQLALYSTRHTGITRLSNIGVPVKIRMMITGDASQGIHCRVYDLRARVPMQIVRDWLEKLRYDEIANAVE
jgi:hypothetical protein